MIKRFKIIAVFLSDRWHHQDSHHRTLLNINYFKILIVPIFLHRFQYLLGESHHTIQNIEHTVLGMKKVIFLSSIERPRILYH